MSKTPSATKRFARRVRGVVVAASAALALALPMMAAATPAAQASTTCPDTMAVRDNNTAGITVLDTNCNSTVLDASNFDLYPKISPNHKSVAFTRVDRQANTADVYVVLVAGGAPLQVTHLSCINNPEVAWSPDSTKLAVNCSVSATDPGIYLANADGSGTSRLTSLQFGQNGLAWCGTKLVGDYTASTGGLYTLNASDGSNLQPLWTDPNAGFFGDPTCSPDTKWVFFDEVTFSSNTTDIFTIPLTGGMVTKITQGGDGNSYPAVSSNWTMTYMHTPSNGGSAYLVNQWLGASQVVLGPTNGAYPSYAPGGGTAPPTAFPVMGSVPPDPGTPLSGCPTTQFFGVRGSGETTAMGGGYGDTVQSVKLTLAAQIPNLGAAPIEYPAVPVGYSWQSYGTSYNNSVSAGESALQTSLLTFISQCPHTYVILAGYSQGAQVVGNVADTLPSSQRKHLAAVILFGDPRFNPKQAAVDVKATGYNPKLKGIYQFTNNQMRRVPSNLTGRLRSYCLGGDPICNFSTGNVIGCANTCPHLDYLSDGWTFRAANWALSQLATLPRL